MDTHTTCRRRYRFRAYIYSRVRGERESSSHSLQWSAVSLSRSACPAGPPSLGSPSRTPSHTHTRAHPAPAPRTAAQSALTVSIPDFRHCISCVSLVCESSDSRVRLSRELSTPTAPLPTLHTAAVALTNTHSHVFRSRGRVCKSGGADVRVFSLRARRRCAPRAPCAVCAERSGAFLQAASGSQRSAPRLRRPACASQPSRVLTWQRSRRR